MAVCFPHVHTRSWLIMKNRDTISSCSISFCVTRAQFIFANNLFNRPIKQRLWQIWYSILWDVVSCLLISTFGLFKSNNKGNFYWATWSTWYTYVRYGITQLPHNCTRFLNRASLVHSGLHAFLKLWCWKVWCLSCTASQKSHHKPGLKKGEKRTSQVPSRQTPNTRWDDEFLFPLCAVQGSDFLTEQWQYHRAQS